MKRRTFLSLLASAAVGLAIDPDLANWQPNQKTFILPPAEGWKAIHDAQQEYNGLRMRFVRQFDVDLRTTYRYDVLYGVSTLRPELACRISG